MIVLDMQESVLDETREGRRKVDQRMEVSKGGRMARTAANDGEGAMYRDDAYRRTGVGYRRRLKAARRQNLGQAVV